MSFTSAAFSNFFRFSLYSPLSDVKYHQKTRLLSTRLRIYLDKAVATLSIVPGETKDTIFMNDMMHS